MHGRRERVEASTNIDTSCSWRGTVPEGSLIGKEYNAHCPGSCLSSLEIEWRVGHAFSSLMSHLPFIVEPGICRRSKVREETEISQALGELTM